MHKVNANAKRTRSERGETSQTLVRVSEEHFHSRNDPRQMFLNVSPLSPPSSPIRAVYMDTVLTPPLWVGYACRADAAAAVQLLRSSRGEKTHQPQGRGRIAFSRTHGARLHIAPC